MNRDLYLAWLKDAHAMETALVPILESHAKLLDSQPTMQSRVQQHIQETKAHATLLEGCIEKNGGSISSVKEGLGALMGKMQGAMSGMPDDSLIKNALRDFSAEQMEIASYTSLIAGARAIGDQDSLKIYDRILQDEQSMASWILEQIPIITQVSLGTDVVTSQRPADTHTSGSVSS
jgi:ferritin-like metal-binding protein YciE